MSESGSVDGKHIASVPNGALFPMSCNIYMGKGAIWDAGVVQNNFIKSELIDELQLFLVV